VLRLRLELLREASFDYRSTSVRAGSGSFSFCGVIVRAKLGSDGAKSIRACAPKSLALSLTGAKYTF